VAKKPDYVSSGDEISPLARPIDHRLLTRELLVFFKFTSGRKCKRPAKIRVGPRSLRGENSLECWDYDRLIKCRRFVAARDIRRGFDTVGSEKVYGAQNFRMIGYEVYSREFCWLNSKFEYRNPKQTQKQINLTAGKSKTPYAEDFCLEFCIFWSFEIVSNFGFRASDYSPHGHGAYSIKAQPEGSTASSLCWSLIP